MKTTVVSIRESPGVLLRFLLLEGKAKGKQANKWLKLLVHVDETENNSVNSFLHSKVHPRRTREGHRDTMFLFCASLTQRMHHDK